MSAALLTATVLSIAGLCAATLLGHAAVAEADLWRHATAGLFVTMITLLSHSMTMFYLIGKGKAVREAASEGGLAGSYAAEITRRRRPVFSIGTLAMALTMTTAILGASVDVGVLSPAVHAALAYASIAANLVALRFEVVALTASARVVSEVNRLLNHTVEG